MAAREEWMHTDQPQLDRRAGDVDPDRAAVFLDRDGTLNVKPPEGDYLRRTSEFEWLPGAAQGAAILARAGFSLFVVSNQRGVARGLVAEATLASIEDQIQAGLRPLGACIEAFRYCRHDLGAGCDCRKPRPGMILRLAAERGLKLDLSWVIGDSVSDVEAGKRAGCKTILLGSASQALDSGNVADLVAPSLLWASQHIIRVLAPEPSRAASRLNSA